MILWQHRFQREPLTGGMGINGLVGGIGATFNSGAKAVKNTGKGIEKGWDLGKKAVGAAADSNKGKIKAG